MTAIFPGAVATQAQMWTQVNGISTTLNGAIDNLVVTVTVVDTTSFPSTGYFVIDTEVIKYTGKTGTSFTGCTRGSDGSTAASHATAAVVAAYAVADHHNKVTEELNAVQTLLGSNTQDLDLTARAGYGVLVKSPSGNHTGRIFLDDDGTLALNLLT